MCGCRGNNNNNNRPLLNKQVVNNNNRNLFQQPVVPQQQQNMVQRGIVPQSLTPQNSPPVDVQPRGFVVVTNEMTPERKRIERIQREAIRKSLGK